VTGGLGPSSWRGAPPPVRRAGPAGCIYSYHLLDCPSSARLQARPSSILRDPSKDLRHAQHRWRRARRGSPRHERPGAGQPSQRGQVARPQDRGRQGALLAERAEARPARAEGRRPSRGGCAGLRGAGGGARGGAGTGGRPADAPRAPRRRRRLAPGARGADGGRAVREPAPPRARGSRPRPDPGRERRPGLPDPPALQGCGGGRALARAQGAEGAPGGGGPGGRARAAAARDRGRDRPP
jgi:hypothetical protein